MKYSDLPFFARTKDTLKALAHNGAEDFYTGFLGHAVVHELEGALTQADLAGYEVVEREAISVQLGKFRVVASPAPSSGPQVLAVLIAMQEYKRRYGYKGVDSSYLNNLTTVKGARFRRSRAMKGQRMNLTH